MSSLPYLRLGASFRDWNFVRDVFSWVFSTFDPIVLVSLGSFELSILTVSHSGEGFFLEVLVLDMRAVVLYHLFFYPGITSLIMLSFFLPWGLWTELLYHLFFYPKPLDTHGRKSSQNLWKQVQFKWRSVNNVRDTRDFITHRSVGTSSCLGTKGLQNWVSLRAIFCRDCQERKGQKESRMFFWIGSWTECLAQMSRPKVRRRRKN